MSDTIRVQFFGICTHMEPGSLASVGVPVDFGHRVVLVNASNQERIDSFPELRDMFVKPHVAALQILRKDVIGDPQGNESFPLLTTNPTDKYVIWALRGVVMTVRDAVPVPNAKESGICIPHLSHFVPHHELPEPGPSAYDRKAEDAACYFDFPASTFYGRILQEGGGAAIGIVDVHVDGQAVIDVESFDRKRKVAISVQPNAQISLSNIPALSEADHDADFLLHYMLCKTFPHDARFPLAAPLLCQTFDTDNVPQNFNQLTGPGCSNSSYP